MYGKYIRDIIHVPEMCLVETCQVNVSCPFNVPDMFPPVSRGPHPQCGFETILSTQPSYPSWMMWVLRSVMAMRKSGVVSLGAEGVLPGRYIESF